MVTYEGGYKADRLPVEEMQDSCRLPRPTVADPIEAYGFAGWQGMEIARDFADETQPTTRSLGSLRYWVALTNQLGTSLVTQGKIPPYQPDQRSKYFGNIQSKLTEKGVYVDIIGTVQSAQELTREETRHHFLGELSDYRAYLAGEKVLTTDEETSKQVKPKDAEHYAFLAEALLVDALYGNIGTLSNDSVKTMQVVEKIKQNVESVEQEVQKITSLLLSANKIGFAIYFARIVSDPRLSDPLTGQIVAKLREIREVEGEASYQRVYDYATQTLNERQRERFLQQ